mgnify:CR=1 FL=1
MYRIAIVDDDYMVRESTKAVIDGISKRKIFKLSGFSTFSQLQSELSQELFTVYILDIELPTGMDWSLQKSQKNTGEGIHRVPDCIRKICTFRVRSPGISLYYQRKYGKKLVQTMRQICREIGIHVKGQYLVKRAGVFEKVALREICYIYKEQKNSIFVTLQGKKANRDL